MLFSIYFKLIQTKKLTKNTKLTNHSVFLSYIRNSQIKSKDQLVKYIYFYSSKYSSIYKINFKFKNL